MDAEDTKALGQFRLHLNDVFRPFQMYGLQDYVPKAQAQIEELALRLHYRLSGLDIPIHTEAHR